MQADFTRPGVLPRELLHAGAWNAEAVRKVSFDDPSWRAVLVSDDAGPVGAVCFSEPSIHAYLIVDAVVLHPEREGSAAQLGAVVEAALPFLRSAAQRFKATRIVFDAATPALRALLGRYDAREESVTLSIALDAQPRVEKRKGGS